MSKDNAARISLRALRREVTGGNYALGPHAVQHAVKEEFTVADVVQVVLTGVLVEEYPSRRRCLLYADVTIEGVKLPLHVVREQWSLESPVAIVTAYIPSENEWITPTRRKRR